MIFYEIEMLSIPEISFACNVKTTQYKNEFFLEKDFLEISLGYSDIALYHLDGSTDIAPPFSVTVITKDLNCRSASYESEVQQHNTVGVQMKYNLTKYTDTDAPDPIELQQRIQKGNVILLPHLYPLQDDFEKAVRLMQSVIVSHGAAYGAAPLKAISHWYMLTSFLTDCVMRYLNKISASYPPSEYIYADKASKYIMLHIVDKLTVGKIADNVGISQGYLNRIFRNIYGCGVIAYIKLKRVSLVKQLVQNKNISMTEAAKNVGIEDVAYMSRLFKKVTGISFRQYIQNKKET